MNDLNSKDEIIKIIKKEIEEGKIDKLIENLLYGSGEDIVINKDNIIYQRTSSDNQNIQEYNNVSTIILGECENKLRQQNNIDNLYLYLKLIILKKVHFHL